MFEKLFKLFNVNRVCIVCYLDIVKLKPYKTQRKSPTQVVGQFTQKYVFFNFFTTFTD